MTREAIRIRWGFATRWRACVERQDLTSRRDGRRSSARSWTARRRRRRSAGCWSALRMKGETVDELVGAARAMRARMTRVAVRRRGDDRHLRHRRRRLAVDQRLDDRGVRGRRRGRGRRQARQPRAVVAVRLARRASRRWGCTRRRRPSCRCAACTRRSSRFCSRPRTTPRPSTSVGPRKELGFRTLFNLLGPLTNPAGVRVHVNGIFARERCELLAQAHGALGSRARARRPRRGRPGRDSRRRARRSSPS